MFIRYSIALCAGGLFTGLAYYHHSKKSPFLVSAQPYLVKDKVKDVSEVIWKKTKSYILKNFPRLAEVVKYGIPSYDCLQIREAYILSYNRQKRVAHWVLEYLTKDMLEGDAERSYIFKTDASIHPFYRSTKDDYVSSGFDKGHLAKAGNYKSCQKAMDETFLMSNMAPQDPKFNRHELWRALEDHVIKLVKQKYGKYKSVNVCSGPLYLPRELKDEHEAILLNLLEENETVKTGNEENFIPNIENNMKNMKKREKNNDGEQKKYYVIYKLIGENLVAVPTHYFKVLLCKVEENLYDIEAYVIPNKPYDPKTSKTPESRALKEITSNKSNYLENTKTPDDRTLKEVIPNKLINPEISKASEDSRLKEFLIPKDAIEKAAGFLIYPELEQCKIRRTKLKGTASSEYYNI